jgi:3-deoxy-manno-octulosonate cytidylyltransferase (CMP-KDO synthetase)
MQFFGIIPARYASTRFPGKPLALINGVSMIQRVYEQALQSKSLSGVLVATDDERIFEHVNKFGKVVYTSADHPSGTDRCFEAAHKMASDWNVGADDVIVNIQGDEPYIQPEQIDEVCSCFTDSAVQIATLVKKIEDPSQVFDENVVKVVTGKSGRALYFSRSAMPYVRGQAKDNWLASTTFYRHIGMYAYQYQVLEALTRLAPSPLEKAESLEQLRWLENGFQLFTRETFMESHAVDTPADLERIQIIH